jgi:putative ABC transport system permease protein
LKRRLLGATVTATVLSAFSQAWASWKTAPGVALLAIVAFGVGIGSATAIFTVVSGVLLRPLPYPSSERFVSLSGRENDRAGHPPRAVGS